MFLAYLTTTPASPQILSQVRLFTAGLFHTMSVIGKYGSTALFVLLTGAGRYIPGSSSNGSAPSGVADPFTGELLPGSTIWKMRNKGAKEVINNH